MQNTFLKGKILWIPQPVKKYNCQSGSSHTFQDIDLSGAASVHKGGQKWVTQVKGRVKKNRWMGNRGHCDQRAALNPDCGPDAQHLLCMHLYSRKLLFPGRVKNMEIWCKISQEEWSKMLPTPNRKVSLNVKTRAVKAAEQVLDYSCLVLI